MKMYFFSFIIGSTCTAVAFYASPPPFPLSSFLPVSLFFHFLPARGPPLRMLPQPFSSICCIAFARRHRKTVENLCRYSQPFHRVCPQSTVSEKMTSCSTFQYAGRGPAVTHPSTDPAPSCLTRVTTCCQTPTTHRTKIY